MAVIYGGDMPTSKLQKSFGTMLYENFPQFTIYENYRPDWLMSSNLTRLELDYFLPEINIAYEIQGEQHFRYTPYFYDSYSDFEKRKLYDKEKRDLCYGTNVNLIEICTDIDAIVEIQKLSEIISNHNINLIPNRNKTICPKAMSKPIKIRYSIRIYLRELLLLSEDFQDANKKDELLRLYNKLRHFCKRGENEKGKVFYFEFRYLSNNEQRKIISDLCDCGIRAI